MADEILVTLSRPSEMPSGLGFSLLSIADCPPVIYDIIENTPAAECAQIEVGDIIIKINNEDVRTCTTKEVLKCLRLAKNPITLKLVRDPAIKNKVHEKLSEDENSPQVLFHDIDSPPPPPKHHPPPLEMVTRTNTNKVDAPKYEAFMMTGERVIKMSKNTQASLLPKRDRKVDCLVKNGGPNKFQKVNSNSVPSSPVENDRPNIAKPKSGNTSPVSPPPTSISNFKRESRSEDPLRSNSEYPMSSTTSIDTEDEDITSSCNTLLNTNVKPLEIEDKRVLWTYNAGHIPDDTSASCNSLQKVMSPTSPTSISSSLMSSPSDRRRPAKGSYRGNSHPNSSHSNISSPDFQDTADSDFLINSRELEVSDPSDSDSTIVASEPKIRKRSTEGQYSYDTHNDHRIVIQVKGPDKTNLVKDTENNNRYYNDKENINNNENQDFKDEEDVQHLLALMEGAAQLANSVTNNDDHWTLNEDVDSDSLHSFHYSPKGVDMPSAVRLAKRLFYLEGFKKSDVSRHLSKNNEFSRAVAEEYLKYFDFKGNSLDLALRQFLKQFSLTGETQERERVLVHFSKRFLDCNPQCFNSPDAVHTLTCAIMLLNTDLHGHMIGRKMTCNEFIENLAGLNDNEHFPRDILKQLYMAIKSNPLEWASDDDLDDNQQKNANASQPVDGLGNKIASQMGKSGSYDENVMTQALEYKKGYVMRKCCMEANGKKTARGKRSWKMYFCTLRDLILYLHKDDSGFRKSQISDNIHNAIHIHHGLATKATDYTKKQHVFRLVTADQAEYLFQTSDPKELDSWINTINFVCASFSAPRLPSAVGNQKKFQRPLLPSAPTKLNLREQLREHEDTLRQLEVELDIHKKKPPERGSKNITLQFYKEKEVHLFDEVKRYKTYVYLLKSKMIQHSEYDSSTALMETDDEAEVVSADDKNCSLPVSNRYSYNAAIYSTMTSN
ncbi:Sec7 domain, alpha orthogonal bundle,PH domain-like,Sec7 domain,Pleckstrin homology domain,PDZ [Cinara cedri]|uniref:Sec7 domain, alpha orthogonal bundle,PH domain-like,Sec7 domain,Pleckstrin homology domain,PDZ n=1 Tax=Cinara cedri TaxID=506608 RepID=A0A5E4M1S8_9HEMI|nr:Sec7 domain, alpha orthogonal bundle,PH domain-like,Sec7 domain,Pleckstrin homology domain,PDZ [Cinara cedri]